MEVVWLILHTLATAKATKYGYTDWLLAKQLPSLTAIFIWDKIFVHATSFL